MAQVGALEVGLEPYHTRRCVTVDAFGHSLSISAAYHKPNPWRPRLVLPAAPPSIFAIWFEAHRMQSIRIHRPDARARPGSRLWE